MLKNALELKYSYKMRNRCDIKYCVCLLICLLHLATLIVTRNNVRPRLIIDELSAISLFDLLKMFFRILAFNAVLKTCFWNFIQLSITWCWINFFCLQNHYNNVVESGKTIRRSVQLIATRFYIGLIRTFFVLSYK